MSTIDDRTELELQLRSPVEKTTDLVGEFINPKMGLFGVSIMAPAAFLSNYLQDNNLNDALIGAANQAAYTFILGGAAMKMCYKFATQIKNKVAAIGLAIGITTSLAAFATYEWHVLNKTPAPTKSMLPTPIILLPITTGYSISSRKKYEFIPLEEQDNI